MQHGVFMAEKGARPTQSVHSPGVHEDTCLGPQKFDRHPFDLFPEKCLKKLMLGKKPSHLIFLDIILKTK
jgi:hypothetical protein